LKTWKAKWILGVELSGLEPRNVFHKELQKSSLSSHREDLKNYHMLVRKTFSLRDKPTRAFLDITADDYYKLYINGRFVSQGPAPSYHFNYNYNHLDVRTRAELPLQLQLQSSKCKRFFVCRKEYNCRSCVLSRADQSCLE